MFYAIFAAGNIFSVMKSTSRQVIEVIDTPIKTIGGRRLIRRVEKILMPNGRYRYPETYIEMTPEVKHISREELDRERIPGY